jgi:hypothetical protein
VSGDVLEVNQSIIDRIDDGFRVCVFLNVPMTASTHWDKMSAIVLACVSARSVAKIVKKDGSLYDRLNVTPT